MWGIFNNLAYSQHRNACERKVQSAKRLIKQALGGVPGPIGPMQDLSWSMLETVLCMGANAMNNCPYLDEQNEHLLCPADLISPWNACEIPVKRVPESEFGIHQEISDDEESGTLKLAAR